jgi:hypothetical protein
VNKRERCSGAIPLSVTFNLTNPGRSFAGPTCTVKRGAFPGASSIAFFALLTKIDEDVEHLVPGLHPILHVVVTLDDFQRRDSKAGW